MVLLALAHPHVGADRRLRARRTPGTAADRARDRVGVCARLTITASVIGVALCAIAVFSLYPTLPRLLIPDAMAVSATFKQLSALAVGVDLAAFAAVLVVTRVSRPRRISGSASRRSCSRSAARC